MNRSNPNPILRRLFTIGLGVVIIWIGSHYVAGQGDSSHGFSFAQSAGVFLSLSGLLILIYGLFRKSIPKSRDDNLVICKKCFKSFYAKDIVNSTCPECGGATKILDGFYKKQN
jgi:hypothetical protein